jgi:hypothetical protein
MNRLVSLGHLAVFAALAVSMVWTGRVAVAHSRSRPTDTVAALPAVPFLEAVALEYREAAADLCWMQAVQYYGEHRQGGNDLSRFGHYLDAVQTLAPRYEHAYLLGAVVLATDGGRYDAAMDVLRRGSRALPQSHAIPFHMGFLTFVVERDSRRAASWFGYASRWPQGRQRALRFQAFMNRRLGDLERAWALWQDILQNSEDESMRIIAKENIKKIEADLRARRNGT